MHLCWLTVEQQFSPALAIASAVNLSKNPTKKSMKRASADVGLIFVVYNLRRIMNIIGQDKLKAYLKAYLKALSFIFRSIMACFKAITRSNFFKLCKILLKYAAPISKLLPNFKRKFSPEIAFGGGY